MIKLLQTGDRERGSEAGGWGGGRRGASLTKYHELLAEGPEGCGFSGLERGSSGRPSEQLGQEFTAAEAPPSEARTFLTVWGVMGRQESGPSTLQTPEGR